MPYTGGLYTGLSYVASPVDDAAGVKTVDDLLQSLVDARLEDTVVAIFMMPTAFYPTGEQPVTKGAAVARPTSIDGYLPHNKKLFTYPYTFCCVDTLSETHNYRFEWSQSPDTLHFSMTCAMSPNPEIVCFPRGYNGTQGDTPETATVNATETVCLSGFPQCAFTIDAYRAWLAQSSTQGLLGLTGAAFGTSLAALSGNLAGGTLGLVGVASQVTNMLMQATAGSKNRGVQGSSTEVGYRVKGIYFKLMTITAQYAEMIDDFFSKYGYATCKIKVPNRNVRPHWTYTKTKDVSIYGDVPNEDMVKLRTIYDNGITFWNNADEVGNYALDNSPA